MRFFHGLAAMGLALGLAGCAPADPYADGWPGSRAGVAYRDPLSRADPWRGAGPYGYGPDRVRGYDWRDPDRRDGRRDGYGREDRRRAEERDDRRRREDDSPRRRIEQREDSRDRDREERPRTTRRTDREREDAARRSARCTIANLPDCPNYQSSD